MSEPRVKRKNLYYPTKSVGRRLAGKARKMASKHTAEERREHINGALAIIYAGAKGATPSRC
jgi:hypothetical protein